jgi:hypothetical protein
MQKIDPMRPGGGRKVCITVHGPTWDKLKGKNRAELIRKALEREVNRVA